MLYRFWPGITRAGILLGLALLAGCGGSGGGDAAPAPPPVSNPPPAPPPSSQPPAPGDGFVTQWFGAIGADDVDLDAEGEEITVWITEDGRFRFVWLDLETWDHGDGLFTGTLTPSPDGFAGEGLAYAPSGVVWADGSLVTRVTVTAEIASDAGDWRDLAGSWSTAAGDHGRFTLSETRCGCVGGAPPDALHGTWLGDNAGPGAGLRLEVAADGTFSGSNPDGCRLSGYFTAPGPRSGLHEMSLTVADCALAGDYEGLALRDHWYEAFYFSADDGNRALTYVLFR